MQFRRRRRFGHEMEKDVNRPHSGCDHCQSAGSGSGINFRFDKAIWLCYNEKELETDGRKQLYDRADEENSKFLYYCAY